MPGLGGLGRGEDVAKSHDLAVLIGNLDTNSLLAGDGGKNPDVGGGQRVGDVLVEAGDAGDLHALT